VTEANGGRAETACEEREEEATTEATRTTIACDLGITRVGMTYFTVST